MQETQRNHSDYMIGVALGRVGNPEDFLSSFRSQIEASFQYVRELQWARLTESQTRFFEKSSRVSVILRGVWTTTAPNIRASIGWDKRNGRARKQELLNVEKISVKPVSNITRSDFERSGYSQKEFEDNVIRPRTEKFNPFSPVTIIELTEIDL